MDYKNRGLIFSPCLKIKVYNPKVPIYVKDENEKVYELSVHPDRKCDWNTRNTCIETMFTYIPFLKFKGLSDLEIEELKHFSTPFDQQDNVSKTTPNVNMQPLKVSHKIEDVFLEL